MGWTKPVPAPGFELVATVLKSNSAHKALIRNTSTRTLQYVSVGVELAPGVILSEISPRRVTLNEGGESRVYSLEH